MDIPGKLVGIDAAAIAIDASQIKGVLQPPHHREYRMTLATAAPAPAYDPGSWSTFFTLTGTVAATLTGLFFVAFSLRVRDLQLSVVIRTRAAYLLTLLIVIVVYSAFVLMPGQSRSAVAAEILFVSVAGVAYLCGWCLPRLAVFSADLVIRWIAGVTGLYRELFPAGGVVLDLMGSWVAHIPWLQDHLGIWAETVAASGAPMRGER